MNGMVLGKIVGPSADGFLHVMDGAHRLSILQACDDDVKTEFKISTFGSMRGTVQ